MGTNWSAPDVVEWKETAREHQKKYYLLLGVSLYDEYQQEQYGYLDAKIACSIYGPPEKASQENICSLAGYTDDQRETAEKIRQAIVGASETGTVYMSVFYVSVKIHEDQFDVPVFRLWLKNSDQRRFVDAEGRLYQNYEDYLENNKLPKCMYCYPSEGFYTCKSGNRYEYDALRDPLLSYGTSPACGLTARVGRQLDWTCTSLVSASIGFSAGSYAAVRYVNSLVDRETHGQPIESDNRESIGFWLSIVGSAAGLGALAGAAAVARAAQAGSTMNVASRFVVTALSVGSLSVNVAGGIFGMDTLIEKGKRNELDTLDVLQFSMSAFFFTHSAINFRTASTIIKDTQNDVFSTARMSLLAPQSRENFKEFVEINYKLGERGPMHRNAGTIRQLNLIGNREQFFGNLGVALADIRSIQGDQHISFNDGLLQINKELDIHPEKFSQMSDVHKSQVVKSTNDLMNGRISYNKFLEEVKDVKSEERLGFNTLREEFKQKAAEAFGVNSIEDVEIGGKLLFKGLRGVDVDRLSKVFADSSRKFDANMVEGVRVLAEAMGCSSAHQFASFMEYTHKHLLTKAKSKTAKDEFAKQLANPKSEQSMGLKTAYMNHFNEVSAVNMTLNPNFSCNTSATYHYVKHNEHQGKVMSVEEYFDLSKSLFGESEFQDSIKLSQDGNRTSFSYLDSARDLFGVVVETHVDGRIVQHIATIFYKGRQ